MKIKWLAHASFLITADDGTRIITDPYTTTDNLMYGKIQEAADIVTVSHEHGDHNNTAAISGNPKVVRGPVSVEIKGIKIMGLAAYHDTSGGKQRGPDTVYTLVANGIRICHLGDLGHPLPKEQVAELGEIDVLLVPAGGFFTMEPVIAAEFAESLKPRVIIPMHFKTPKVKIPILPVDEFLKGKQNVKRLPGSEVSLTKSTLPHETEIIVLTPSL